MLKWIVAASLLLGQAGPEAEYDTLIADAAAKQKKRDEDARDAHKALDEGDYDKAVELAKNARRLEGEVRELRGRARALLRAVLSELVMKLDHDEYNVREGASAKLRSLGQAAVPTLVKLRSPQMSPEMLYRIDELLKGVSVDPSGRVRQWAKEAAASSQYTASGWSAAQVTGAPDTLVAGDAQTAWAAKDADGGTEWLHVKYAIAVRISKLRIHETFTPGGVVAVDVVNADGSRRRVWEGNDPSDVAPAWFEIDLQGVVGREVVVTLDTKKRPGWEEIDAIELVGELLDE